jgi:hypothetical protein
LDHQTEIGQFLPVRIAAEISGKRPSRTVKKSLRCTVSRGNSRQDKMVFATSLNCLHWYRYGSLCGCEWGAFGIHQIDPSLAVQEFGGFARRNKR